MNTTGDANRSVRRTKGKLKAALIQLMLNEPVKDITVRQIAELADVSRGTFYLYYRDVYDMVATHENALLSELKEITAKIDPRAPDAAYKAILETLQLVQDNSELFRALLGPNGSHEFVNGMSEILDKPLSDSIRPLASREGTVRLVSSFFIKGFIGLIEEWLADGLQESPENMAAIVSAQLSDAQHFVLEKRRAASAE
ncbi:MAG: TetR/AcrR family transcriptional regulator [Oscillospiraceae bacterium]|jgi:AcrR family transcriptional regulator